jgi:hypothetical protein
MSFENVQLWFAKKEDGEIITINEVDKSQCEKYYCPLCKGEVVPKQGEINSWHFAHEDKSECSSETRVHFWVKNKLIEKGTEFTIKSDVEKKYICKDILIEQSYEVDGKTYRPDLTVLTETGETIFFEMEYSNTKKLEDYLDIWIALGNIVVQVDTKALINSSLNNELEFDALWYNGKCFNIKKDNLYYNTIGKYKEQILKNGEYKKRREEIQKLDWFWRDIIKYKQQKVSIEYLAELIESIDDEECVNLIFSIVKKLKCTQFLQDYNDYVKTQIDNYLKNTIPLINKKLIYRIEDDAHVKLYYKNHIVKDFQIKRIRISDEEIDNIKNIIVNIENEIHDDDKVLELMNNIKIKYKNLKDDLVIDYRKITIENLYKTRTIIIELHKDNVTFGKKYWDNVKHKYWGGNKYKTYFKEELVYKIQDKFEFEKYNYGKAYEYIDRKISEELTKYEAKQKNN